MFSPETQKLPKDLVKAQRNMGFKSNPHTPNSQVHTNYLHRRCKRSKKSQYFDSSQYIPSVDTSHKGRSVGRKFSPSQNTENWKKVKIRIQGQPGREIWSNLGSDLNLTSQKDSFHNLSNMSIKDAERHAKILAKIEKYKEDKILKELQLIEEEKAKTAKMLRLRREKEEKRKHYIGKYPFSILPNFVNSPVCA